MSVFKTTSGIELVIDGNTKGLKIEHVLQRYRDVWVLVPEHPYLTIDAERLETHVQAVAEFPVFSGAQLWQNLRPDELGHRLISQLFGPGTNAGLGTNGRAFVEGKANAKAHQLVFWNPPLSVGVSTWCAAKTHFIYVDDVGIFQYKFGELIEVRSKSRPSSPHFDFTRLCDLRDRLFAEYISVPKVEPPDLNELSALLDEIFDQNAKSLSAAKAHYLSLVASDGTSTDYEAPTLTKYGRLTHDASGQPRVEVSFALLHYEKAIIEFNEVKACQSAGKSDAAFVHGVYCIVAVAACIEAIANRLVLAATSAHPTYKDGRQALPKLNDAAAVLLATAAAKYVPLVQGQPAFDALDEVRIRRNEFMHAKELEADIDHGALKSMTMTAVDEMNCRRYLKQLRLAAAHVYDQLPGLASPIVTSDKVSWLGDLEVP